MISTGTVIAFADSAKVSTSSPSSATVRAGTLPWKLSGSSTYLRTSSGSVLTPSAGTE